MEVLDLFSAAAGGWSLGMHRAGFTTIAACEVEAWRRALYSENNPGVKVYDDVRTLTADRLFHDLARLPSIVVGSPPCQDVSSANTKGRGVEGERSGLYFEAIRIIGEVRPRWFSLENSDRLRTRGADAIIAALSAIGYTCWPFVVRAGDIGANHERARSWLIGCDLEQVTDPSGFGFMPWAGLSGSAEWNEPEYLSGNAESDGRTAGRKGRRAEPASGISIGTCVGKTAPDTHGGEIRIAVLPGRSEQEAPIAGHAASPADDADTAGERSEGIARHPRGERQGERAKHPDRLAGQPLSHAYQDGEPAIAEHDEMEGSSGPGDDVAEPWADWNLGLAGHLRLDDGLSARLVSTRVAVGGPKGTSGAALIVEAFGDAVVPQIPEAIGRAILRTERALAAIFERKAA